METLTAPQVFALAPDPASAKAGQSLANPAKWSTLGRNERSVWGECQGSALYCTQADLSGPAFHCSCPSRKFPCKHGLGLLLVVANSPTRVPEAVPPTWVEEWIKRRDAGAEKKAAQKPDAGATDPIATAKQEAEKKKRIAKREDRVQAGLVEVQTWLGDLLRHGLASAKEQPARFFDAMAARMIDAQAPGIARRLSSWPGILASGEGWADRALEEAGTLQWLLNSTARLDTLPAPLRASVRAAVGWTISEQELFADPSADHVRDDWRIVGQRIEEEEKLRVQRTWLVGESTWRTALCLSFAAGPQSLDVSLLPGTKINADLVFYPSAAPLRALVRTRHGEAKSLDPPAALANFDEALDHAAGWIAGDPWLERAPWFVRDCIPCQNNGRTALRDASDKIVPLAKEFMNFWSLTAASGGAPATIFGEWNGRALLPLSMFVKGRFIALGGKMQ